MADDLGWYDISAHPGGSIPTPNIDRFFKQGLQLNDFMGWMPSQLPKDTHSRKIEDSGLFTHIRVSPVPATKVGK